MAMKILTIVLLPDDGEHDTQNTLLAIHLYHVIYTVLRTSTQWRSSSKCRKQACSLCERLDYQWVPLKYRKYLLNISLTVWGVMFHLNGFEILILFYILHDCISGVSDWN